MALMAVTIVRLLTYTLSPVLYQRQICTHARGRCDTFHEFAKRLAYGFVALAPAGSNPPRISTLPTPLSRGCGIAGLLPHGADRGKIRCYTQNTFDCPARLG